MSNLNFIFDGPPGPEAGRFVEVENDEGRSVNVGEWTQREEYWALVVPDRFDEGYQIGRDEALEDAANALVDLEHYAPTESTKIALTEAIQSVRKMQGWTECQTCNGTGDNTKPTTQDLLKAMMEDLGAITGRNHYKCRECHGYGVKASPS